MTKAQGKENYKTPISLLLVEGETDELFWQQVKNSSLKSCRIIIKDWAAPVFSTSHHESISHLFSLS